MKFVVFTACVVLTACSGSEPVAPPSGVAPDSSPNLATDKKPAVELAEPLEPTPTPAVETVAAVAVPAPKIAFEIEPLGRFEVITWDEAARRAEAKITLESVQGSLRALRQDLLGRPR